MSTTSPLPPARFLDRSTPPTLFTLVALAGLSALSMNIFLPSLNSMAAWFGVEYGQMQQAVALYLLLSGVLQIFLGPLADRFGRRKVTLASLYIFLLATIGTLIAPNAETFLFCRMLQAVIASGMVLSRAIVRDMVANAEAAQMIAYVTMAMSIVPMVGPMLGGWLDEVIHWKASFGLLLVCGLAVTALCWADLGETRQGPGQSSLRAQFRQYPGLLASPRFWGYSLSAAFASGCFFAYLGGAPYVGSEVYHLSAKEVGFLFGITALGYTIGNFIAGRFSVRVGMNRMLLTGCLVTAAGLTVQLLLSLAGPSGAKVFFGLTFFIGVGNGMAMPNANAGLLSVRPELAGTASGLGGAIMIIGGAGLASIAGRILTPGSTELPLVVLMLVSALAAVLSALAVIWRSKQIERR